MKEKYENISKRTWVRTILVSVLFIIVAFGFAGEKIAFNNGVGYDGENYYVTMQHFMPMIKHHGYDQYAIQRVMPWGIVDIISTIFKFRVSPKIAVFSGIVLNAIALLLSVLYFFRISNYKRWKIETETLGFILLFFTYPVLKQMGYYPVLSDMFGMTIGIMLLYYFLTNNRMALIVLGFAGAFTWPTTPLVAFALAFCPCKPLPCANPFDKNNNRFLIALFSLIAAIPLIILGLTILQYDGDVMAAMRGICPLTIPISKWMIMLACLCTIIYYYYMVSPFKVSLTDMLEDNFTGKTNVVNYGWLLLCVITAIGICKFLANTEPGALTTTQTLQCIALTSMTDPFVFIESYLIYFGLGYLLILFLWKDVAKIIMKQGLGFLFAVALWVLFSIRPEARVSIMYYIFPFFAMLQVIDSKKIRPYVIWIATFVSLILSRFWYKINIPGMEKFLSYDNYWHYTEFPAQRYFMTSGHWQSHEMYVLFTMITLVVGVILYSGIRKGWYIFKTIG